jgi:hypothetical protein
MRAISDRHRSGEILRHAGAAAIHRVGQGLFAPAALGILARGVQILALPRAGLGGQRALAIGLAGDRIGVPLPGAVHVVIGRGRREAARPAGEIGITEQNISLPK